MKKTLKNLVVAILAWQVKRLRKKHQFKIIGVVGSIGKTSTKFAIANTLGKTLRVKYQEGNYNDIASVPLIFFGHQLPSLTNPFAWLKIFISNQRQISSAYPYDVVVVELGTDHPGEIAAFKKYLQLDLAVLTAIAPEHMLYFGTLEAVAQEETAVKEYAGRVIYNLDLVAPEYRTLVPEGSLSYSLRDQSADFYLANIYHSAGGYEGDIKHGEGIYLHVVHEVVSEAQLYSVLAAVIAGKELGLKTSQISAGLASIRPVNGRLRRLRGINNSTIIDDTYNASPETVKADLTMLAGLEAPQKIAILGSMNELGDMSVAAHKEIGSLCKPDFINLLVTMGSEANKYIAETAELNGCTVKRFDTPYDIGEYLQTKIEPGAVILAKGSQGGIFLEEAIKPLLADPVDANKLVRQSEAWTRKKEQAFGRRK